MYFKMKDKIFTGHIITAYDAAPLEKRLQTNLGHDKLIAVKPPPRVLVPSLNIKSYPGKLKFFRYVPPSSILQLLDIHLMNTIQEPKFAEHYR